MADPTVTDVFNQLVFVNGKLDQVEVNTSVISDLNISINKGFDNTVKALQTIALIDIEAVKLLYYLTQQTDTMICNLEHISKNTCEILTQVTIQTRLQTQMRDDLDTLRQISASAHPEAAMSLQRLEELKQQIERCCPPKEPPPACSYEPCDKPKRLEPPKLPEVPKPDRDPKQPG